MSTELVLLFGLATMPIIVSRVAGDRLRPIYLCPPKLLIAFMAIFGIGGYLTLGAGGTLIGSDLIVPEPMVLPALKALFYSSLCAAVGALLCVWARPPLSLGEVSRMQPVRLTRPARSVLKLVAAAPLFLYASSPAFLIERATYSSGQAGSVFIGLARNSTIVAVVVLGYLWPKARQPARILIVIMMCLYWIIIFAQASRQFALMPLFFAIGVFAATLTNSAKRTVILATIVSVLLVPVPLYLRTLSDHGLLPYLNALPELSAQAFSEPFAGVSNVFFGFAVLALTLSRAPSVPLEIVLIQLNPLPGEYAGWYEVADSLRINPAVPYSTIGEVAGAGPSILIAFWLFVGVVLAHIDRRIAVLLADNQQLSALAMLALSMTFVVLASQYNVRNSFRVIFYLLALDLITRIWRGLRSEPTVSRSRFFASSSVFPRHDLGGERNPSRGVPRSRTHGD